MPICDYLHSFQTFHPAFPVVGMGLQPSAGFPQGCGMIHFSQVSGGGRNASLKGLSGMESTVAWLFWGGGTQKRHLPPVGKMAL